MLLQAKNNEPFRRSGAGAGAGTGFQSSTNNNQGFVDNSYSTKASENYDSNAINQTTGFGPTDATRSQTDTSQSQTGGTGSTVGGDEGDWQNQQDQQGQQGQQGQQNNKPSMADKVKGVLFFPFYLSKKICINRGMVVSGTMEKLAGTLKRDEGMKERGQATKVSI